MNKSRWPRRRVAKWIAGGAGCAVLASYAWFMIFGMNTRWQAYALAAAHPAVGLNGTSHVGPTSRGSGQGTSASSAGSNEIVPTNEPVWSPNEQVATVENPLTMPPKTQGVSTSSGASGGSGWRSGGTWVTPSRSTSSSETLPASQTNASGESAYGNGASAGLGGEPTGEQGNTSVTSNGTSLNSSMGTGETGAGMGGNPVGGNATSPSGSSGSAQPQAGGQSSPSSGNATGATPAPQTNSTSTGSSLATTESPRANPPSPENATPGPFPSSAVGGPGANNATAH
ncbi:hypothetical protein [Alicyclobacillus acidocaldarius]|uniref:hypothetical protein n=1 Tax=Alicyclobacillus acidocaldarius TaxID=405212 RepID=UPI0011D2571E|nr:hypothetical protein [Alicyclobacillus acidocaldarius]